MDGRALESVSSTWLDPDTATSLESSGGSKKSEWDQFETNRRLFDVTSSYDENIYTKRLDMSSLSRDQIAFAERTAREIESTVSTNIHVQEERGQLDERELDEEDMYSGVRREPVESTPQRLAAGRQSPDKSSSVESVWRRGLVAGKQQPTPSPQAARKPPTAAEGVKMATPSKKDKDKDSPRKSASAAASASVSASSPAPAAASVAVTAPREPEPATAAPASAAPVNVVPAAEPAKAEVIPEPVPQSDVVVVDKAVLSVETVVVAEAVTKTEAAEHAVTTETPKVEKKTTLNANAAAFTPKAAVFSQSFQPAPFAPQPPMQAPYHGQMGQMGHMGQMGMQGMYPPNAYSEMYSMMPTYAMHPGDPNAMMSVPPPMGMMEMNSNAPMMDMGGPMGGYVFHPTQSMMYPPSYGFVNPGVGAGPRGGYGRGNSGYR